MEITDLITDDIQGLIFDCDGTLVDSMSFHMKAWETAFMKSNTAYDEEFLLAAAGQKETDIVRSYNENFGTNLNPERIVDLKHKFFRSDIHKVQPVKRIADLAFSNKGKFSMAVVSGSKKSTVLKELEIIGLIDIFDIILTAEDPYKPKPAPDLFLEAAKRMRLNPEQCLVFEDGDSGLEGARLAGMKTVDVRQYI